MCGKVRVVSRPFSPGLVFKPSLKISKRLTMFPIHIIYYAESVYCANNCTSYEIYVVGNFW